MCALYSCDGQCFERVECQWVDLESKIKLMFIFLRILIKKSYPESVWKSFINQFLPVQRFLSYKNVSYPSLSPPSPTCRSETHCTTLPSLHISVNKDYTYQYVLLRLSEKDACTLKLLLLSSSFRIGIFCDFNCKLAPLPLYVMTYFIFCLILEFYLSSLTIISINIWISIYDKYINIYI